MMNEHPTDLRVRTKQFGLRIIRLSASIQSGLEAQVIRKQIVRSGTSVGAQYREACRGRSKAEFISKLQSALQELDETTYWMELLIESGIVPKEKMVQIMAEADELIAIFVASLKTAKD